MPGAPKSEEHFILANLYTSAQSVTSNQEFVGDKTPRFYCHIIDDFLRSEEEANLSLIAIQPSEVLLLLPLNEAAGVSHP